MIPLLATTLAVVLGRYLLAGSAIDLGVTAWASAPAVLLLAVAWGLISRVKLPYLADSLALALLVPARGPLCDLLLSVVPWSWGAPHLAALVSLGPLGFALGRQVGTLLEGPVLAPLAGWVVGEALVGLGLVGWLPGWFTGFLLAALLAALVEMGSGRRLHSVGGGDERHGWEALPLGLALGLAAVCLRRVAPAYVTPAAPLSGEVVLGLAVPALPVVAFALLVVGEARWRRVLFSLAMPALAWSLWQLVEHLALFRDTPRMIAMTREYRNLANEGWPLVTDWHLWLTFFSGATAATGGLALAALPRRSLGPLALGLGLGVLAEQWVVIEPLWGVQHLLLAATGLAGAGLLASWNPRWLALLPLAVVPFLLLPQPLETGYDGIRRVGEFSADGWSRSLPADVALFSSGTKAINSVEGRRAAHATFTDREPLLRFDAEGRARFQGELVLGGDEEQPPELLARPTDDDHDHEHFDDDEELDLQRRFGLRAAGVELHPDHDPMGPEGSLGRLNRLFARSGPALVLGVGAELGAADLGDAGLTGELVVGSRLPLGDLITRVLLAHQGSAGLDVPVLDDELEALLATPPDSRSTILLMPDRGAWPGSGDLLAASRLARLAERLAPDGRLLAWIDTTDLSARALASRLAAVGAVFGERSAAFVELREVGPPLVLALGWRTDAGRPRAEELDGRLPGPDRTGFRSRLADLSDLAAQLLLDGAGLATLGPTHDRDRPVSPGALEERGAPALLAVHDRGARLHRVVAGAPAELVRDSRPVLEGLAQHARYFFELYRLRGVMNVEPLADVDWSAFDAEVAHYAEAAAADPDHPLLGLAVAALLEPLLVDQDMTRFAQAFLAVQGERLAGWRLALQHAVALQLSLEQDQAAEALARARRRAGLDP